MKKLICRILGHKFKYNGASLITKCHCERCGMKWKVKFNRGVHPSKLAEWVIDED